MPTSTLATRPEIRPSLAAPSWLESSIAKTAIAAARASRPNSPAASRPPLGLPCRASNASAKTGSASLTKLLKTPDTSSDTVVLDLENPQEENIA
jgi:hypothetical protein